MLCVVIGNQEIQNWLKSQEKYVSRDLLSEG